tara:strand:- start:1538 stop:2476 length:939 start_codon:yes stop_codon:yes gene_type:complete
MSDCPSIYFPDSIYFDSSFLRSHFAGWNIVDECIYNPSVIAAIIRPPEIATADHLSSFPNLELVLSDSTGVSHLTFLESIANISIKTLRNLPSSARSPLTTASDHAFCLAELSLRPILSFYSSLILSDSSFNTSCYKRADFRGLAWQEVSVGIIGFGRIGTSFFNRLPPHVKKVSIYDTDPTQYECNLLDSNVVTISSSLEELFSVSDVILLSVTDSELNRDLISSNCFQHSIHSLINISRPYMVHADSLLEALHSGKINMYLSDFPPRNLHSDFSPFVRDGRMLYLPHMGGCTKFSWDLSLKSILTFLPQL